MGGVLHLGGMVAHRNGNLAACPFCRSEAVFIEYGGGVFVKCSCCECMVAKQISVISENILPFETEEEALKVWNKRNGREVCARRDTTGNRAAVLAERALMIAHVLSAKKGAWISVREISDKTGLTVNQVSNIMTFVKSKYPKIKSRHGMGGYIWGD